MKKCYFFLLTALILSAAACSDDHAPVAAPDNPQPAALATIPVETALADLQWHLEQMPQGTRAATYDATDVQVLRRSDFAATRSEADEADAPLAYVVNFQDGGYAILGADPRQSSVIALVGNGSMQPADLVAAKRAVDSGETVDTPTFIDALVAAYILQAPQDPQAQPRIVGPPSGEWRIAEHQPAMVKTKWGQNGIYNKYCLDKVGNRTAAGCVAIATAQLLLYNHQTYGKGPHYITGWNLDWTKLDQAANYADLNDAPAAVQDAAAKFIHEVGIATKVSYEDSSSLSGISNVMEFMQSKPMQSIYRQVEKYRFPGTSNPNNPYNPFPPQELDRLTFIDYYIRPMLYLSKLPIYISAQTGFPDETGKDKDGKEIMGHAWLLDGWQKKIKRSDYSGGSYIEQYVYCNYGWYGGSDDDKLYALPVFDTPVFAKNYNYTIDILNYKLF